MRALLACLVLCLTALPSWAQVATILGTLSVATTTPIARFVVLEASCTVDGPFCSQILNLDDFVLALAPIPPTPTGTPGPVAVPSSSAWSLVAMMLALGAAAAVRLRRRGARSPRS